MSNFFSNFPAELLVPQFSLLPLPVRGCRLGRNKNWPAMQLQQLPQYRFLNKAKNWQIRRVFRILSPSLCLATVALFAVVAAAGLLLLSYDCQTAGQPGNLAITAGTDLCCRTSDFWSRKQIVAATL